MSRSREGFEFECELPQASYPKRDHYLLQLSNKLNQAQQRKFSAIVSSSPLLSLEGGDEGGILGDEEGTLQPHNVGTVEGGLCGIGAEEVEGRPEGEGFEGGGGGRGRLGNEGGDGGGGGGGGGDEVCRGSCVPP